MAPLNSHTVNCIRISIGHTLFLDIKVIKYSLTQNLITFTTQVWLLCLLHDAWNFLFITPKKRMIGIDIKNFLVWQASELPKIFGWEWEATNIGSLTQTPLLSSKYEYYISSLL